MPSRVLNVVVTGDVKGFQAALAKAGVSTDAFANKQKSAGARATATGAAITKKLTLPLVAFGAVAGHMAADFDEHMQKLVGLVGLPQKSIDGLKTSVLGLSRETGKAPTELADALFFVESAGLRGSNALDALEASAKASTAGLGETKTIADAVTSAMNAYGPANLHAAKATDVLVGAIRAGKVEASALAPTIGQVAPLAQTLGVSFDQVGAALASMTRLNGNARVSATQLRGVFASFLKPTKQSVEALGKMGMSVKGVRQEIREKGLLATLVELRTEAKKNGVDFAQLFPNVRALNGFLGLTGKNAKQNAAIFRDMASATGTTDAAFKSAEQTLNERFKHSLNDVKVSMVQFGEAVLPAVIPVLHTLAGAVSHTSEAFAHLPQGTQQAVAAVGLVAAAVGPLVWIVGKVILTIKRLKVAFLAMRAFALANPFTAAIAGAALLVGALVALGGGEDAETQAAARNAAAKRAQAAAARDLAGAENVAGHERVNAKQSTLDLAAAEQNFARVRQTAKKGSLEYQQAELGVAQAKLSSADAHARYNTSLDKQTGAENRLTAAATKRVAIAKQELDDARKPLPTHGGKGFAGPTPGQVEDRIKRVAAAEKALGVALRGAAAAGDRARVSDLNRARAAAGVSLITTKQATHVRALQAALKGLPPKVKARILLDDANAVDRAGALASTLRGLGKGKTVHHILATSHTADEAVSRLRAALGHVGKGKTTAKVDANTGPARVKLDALKSTLAAFAKSVTYHDVVIRHRDAGGGGGGGGDGKKPKAKVSRATPRAADVLFDFDKQIADAQASSDALDAMFARSDKAAEVAAAHYKARHAKNASDRKQALHDLHALQREAARTNAKARIDFQVAGLQRLKAFKDALAGVRDTLSSVVESAASAFRQGRENSIDAGLNNTLASLDTSHAAELLRQRKGIGADPRVAELAAIRARQTTDDAAAADAQLAETMANAQKKKAIADEQVRKAQEGLARVQGSGSQRLITQAQRRLDLANVAEAAAVATVASVNADITKLNDTRRADELEAELSNARDEAQNSADAAKEGLDAEVADFQAALQAKIDAETTSLEQRREGYAKFAADVQAILAPLGLVFTPSADQEAAFGAPEPAAPKAAPGTKHKAKAKHKHRAAGGLVMSRLGELTSLNEVGREDIFLPHGARVVPASQSRHNGPLIGTVNIHEAGRLDEQAIAARLGFQLATRRR